jgi:hypothetical protein
MRSFLRVWRISPPLPLVCSVAHRARFLGDCLRGFPEAVHVLAVANHTCTRNHSDVSSVSKSLGHMLARDYRRARSANGPKLGHVIVCVRALAIGIANTPISPIGSIATTIPSHLRFYLRNLEAPEHRQLIFPSPPPPTSLHITVNCRFHRRYGRAQSQPRFVRAERHACS